MKTIIPFLLWALTLSACKTVKVDPKNQENNGALIVSMERTGCYGKCPIYQVSIYSNGALFYEGVRFTEKVGKYYRPLSKTELSGLVSELKKSNLPGLKDQYPEYSRPPEDLPACKLVYNEGANTKKITDYGIKSPDELKVVEKMIDELVKSGNLQIRDK